MTAFAFELFYCELWKLPTEDYELQKFKAEIKKEADSLFDNYSFWNELVISKEEFLALKSLSNKKDIILRNTDKSKSAVLVNKADYIKWMKEFFSNVSNFKEHTAETGQDINLLRQYERKLIEFLSELKVLKFLFI